MMNIYVDELKVGNYIDEDNKLTMVYKLSCKDFGKINGKVITKSNFKPVLLTEQILYWFGFYKNDEGFYKGEINLCLNGQIYWNEELICENCFYLHHLQNIWFSLRMKNLILKK